MRKGREKKSTVVDLFPRRERRREKEKQEMCAIIAACSVRVYSESAPGRRRRRARRKSEQCAESVSGAEK